MDLDYKTSQSPRYILPVKCDVKTEMSSRYCNNKIFISTTLMIIAYCRIQARCECLSPNKTSSFLFYLPSMVLFKDRLPGILVMFKHILSLNVPVYP